MVLTRLIFLTGYCIAPTSAQAADSHDAKTPAKDKGEINVRLILPPVLYAVPGIETNVYFDNVTLVLNPANYAFDVTCAKGTQQAERWTFAPSDKDVGVHRFVLEVRDQTNRLVARAASSLRVVPADAGDGRPVSALLVGDSLTHASIYSQHLLDLCRKPNTSTLALIGSHAPKDDAPENRHEGYGGWTAKRFATHYTGIARAGDYRKRGSPFLYKNNGDVPKLDFARYCKDINEGKPVDFVTLFLGCNDTFSATDDTIESRIDEMFTHLDALIEMIRRADDKTCIGLVPPVPPAATQDAFGANYRCGQTRWQYKRNQHRVVERMIERYSSRANQRVLLIGAFVNLDCRHNYPSRTAPPNAHTSLSCTRLSNGVHPAAEGYRQIGDSIYCWLKARLAEK